VWLVVLSDQLPVKALVGRYPANQLIGRDPLRQRPPSDQGALARPCDRAPCGINPPFGGLSPTAGQVKKVVTCYAPVRHSNPRGVSPPPKGPVRLACLIHAASVRSEPESNSPLNRCLRRAGTRPPAAELTLTDSVGPPGAGSNAPPEKAVGQLASQDLSKPKSVLRPVTHNTAFADQSVYFFRHPSPSRASFKRPPRTKLSRNHWFFSPPSAAAPGHKKTQPVFPAFNPPCLLACRARGSPFLVA
jgi:hypothetical protein